MEDITAKVRRIRDAADLIVVSLHWGQEYVPVPSPQQVSMGRLLIDGGVDLVLGTHPHVLQGWERYRGGLIVYSLGNFVFPMEYISGTDVGIITRIIFSGKGQWQVTGIPVRSNPRSHAPEIPDTRESQDILGHLRELQELLEGCSVDEYARRIGDYDSLLRLNKRQALRAMKVHVLRNFYRYPPRHLLHLLQGYIGKRVANAAI
jgi:poly-gamma-glutamate synthesis protein (capsule biosynthesis protein)